MGRIDKIVANATIELKSSVAASAYVYGYDTAQAGKPSAMPSNWNGVRAKAFKAGYEAGKRQR